MNDSIKQRFPPGHFYSPIPSLTEVSAREKSIFPVHVKGIPGIELNEEQQLALLEKFIPFYKEIPFTDRPKEGLRYYYLNSAYSYTDAIILYSMVRLFRPARIIEIGSGFSSCVMLDTNELFFNNTIKCTFINPFQQTLKSLLKPEDAGRIEIVPLAVQDVDLNIFDSLEAGDILFVDSTHVSKVGSDVNFIIFKILPRLKPGVLIHFHDIFYPFEYPKPWIMEGRAWNEAYVLKAFLQYNTSFRIVLFSHFLTLFHRQSLHSKFPLCAGDLGGNLWIRRYG